jgi:exodeoxyribonuclease VII small subunit
MPRKAKTDENIDFEKAMQELESLVAKMENGDLSLEESLNYFEQGVKLTRQCQQSLKKAEQKVAILLKKDKNSSLNDFDDS